MSKVTQLHEAITSTPKQLYWLRGDIYARFKDNIPADSFIEMGEYALSEIVTYNPVIQCFMIVDREAFDQKALALATTGKFYPQVKVALVSNELITRIKDLTKAEYRELLYLTLKTEAPFNYDAAFEVIERKGL